MSTNPNDPAPSPDAIQPDAAPPPPPMSVSQSAPSQSRYGPRRYPLGLPAGSIRSLLSLMIVGLVSIIIAVPADYAESIPPYLVYLLFLMLGSFFAAHGTSIARGQEKGPLGLPHGSIRLVLFVVLIGVIVWKLISSADGWERQFANTIEAMSHQPYMIFAVLGGFFVGIIIKTLVGRDSQSVAYQDIMAWISLVAMGCLVLSYVIELLVNPSLQTHNRLEMPKTYGGFAAIIAFYFGARS
ncbi:MAG: hypothetical protein ACFCD0_02310 [Gemmataceae bacterium]